MVITPQQAQRKLNRKDALALKNLEGQIDQNLVLGNNMIRIVGGLNARIKDRLLHEYRHAGWDVEYQIVPQKGDCLYFNKHKEVVGFRPY